MSELLLTGTKRESGVYRSRRHQKVKDTLSALTEKQVYMYRKFAFPCAGPHRVEGDDEPKALQPSMQRRSIAWNIISTLRKKAHRRCLKVGGRVVPRVGRVPFPFFFVLRRHDGA